ncbi:zymogen granule membrane protein 16-like isoform X2 [Hemicordylus capensis]|uniref:zymogen granule membrane protein 16-like isoform X2 n=1 Tax=Hemicordylus capensis TaxID=884348 RepID=UPI002304D16D|nr:zymogen granule membrane protein 16-like isoform X2 [Hemicordylus capensis]
MFLQIIVLVIALFENTVSDNPVRYRSVYSYSGEYGAVSGKSFSYSTDYLCSLITGFRIWEVSSSYITGIQLEFNNTWSKTYGIDKSKLHEVILFPGEHITQVSGKENTYIYQLIFVTSMKRIFFFGQPSGYSFNAYPMYQGNILLFLIGHTDSNAITGIGFHWHMAKLFEGNCQYIRG